MNLPTTKPMTRLLKRQIKKSFGESMITDARIIHFINLVNDAYLFHDDEKELYRHAEKIANRDYVRINNQLNEKNDFLDTFNNGMAHDVKNHTSNIIGLITMLKKYTQKKDWDMIQEITERLNLSSHQLTSIVKGFLYLSKAESNEGDELMHIQVNDIIQAVEEEIGYLKEVKETCINYNLDKVVYNQYVIKIILVNLISNSIKYSQKDKPAIIDVSLSCDPTHVYVEVNDNGMGMDLKKNKKLFNLFNTTSHSNGYGVGLFLVKKIIDKNKGEITVNSQVNRGTNIKIKLPKNI